MLFWDVIERHFDEADFLWGVWERSLLSPTHTLDRVARGPEERLWAHIDGLVANGPEVARRLLFPALEEDDPSRVRVAASALLQTPGEAGIEAVIVALRARPGQRGPMVRALACSDRPEVSGRMRELLESSEQGLVTAAAEVLAFHHTPLEAVLPRLLESDSPSARALGLRALLNVPASARQRAAAQEGLRDKDSGVVAAAMEVGCRLGLREAWRCVRERALRGDPEALLLLALGGGPAEYKELSAALAEPAHRPAALWALGFVGTPEILDASLEWLEDKRSGPLSGEVFTAVTGVTLMEANLTAPPKERRRLVHTPEDDLPLPDPAKVRDWWTRNRGRFADGQRYLLGEPRSVAGMLAALKHGPMRRRLGILVDLQLRASARHSLRLQPRAPTRQQYAELSAIAAHGESGFNLSRLML
ncbi:TIGR02270 family protein [Hyalangium versicolor]|uniref:TIGR02270 family protein n=1 Tax=Hyalangium versicolor TaxID=2861190 RepID=UPI001CCACAE2|nr:TIGR02270 family protein [Hyalangium versicolor]